MQTITALTMPDCKPEYDAWADKYYWPCRLEVMGRFAGAVPANMAELVASQHRLHHAAHDVQQVDWTLVVSSNDIGLLTVECQHHDSWAD